MGALVDSSILVRFLELSSPLRPDCVAALAVAKSRKGEFQICAQVAIELWVVATRPRNVNGLGLSPSEVADTLAELNTFLPMLAEPPDISTRWRELVTRHAVVGKPAHDARLVAIMNAYSIPAVLTLNRRDFARYPAVRIVSPQDVLAGRA